jgi:CHAT domain
MAILNILVVAPEHPDLPEVLAEVAAIAQQHDVVALTGVVRDRDIAAAVQEGPYDVIWFASHGDEQGVLLSDGVLDIAGVGQYVRASGADLCVLNTCDSETVALAMIAGSDAHLICTISEVEDGDAQRFGLLLARALAEQSDYKAAYEQVAPVGGKYRYLTARTRSMPRVDRVGEMVDQLYHVAGDVRALRTWLVALVVAMVILFAMQMIVWQRTDLLTQEIISLKQQALYLERDRGLR